MIASTIWNQLVYTLSNAPILSYIKFVYEGQRWDIGQDSVPCLMIEPVQNNEKVKEFSNVKDVYFTVNVIGVSSANYGENPRTIVGGPDYKGILDIENDVRAVLQRSYTLGGKVMDVQAETVLFDQLDINKYPSRVFLMPVRILYRQQNEV